MGSSARERASGRFAAATKGRAVAVPTLTSVKAPRILAVASAIDLRFRYGCTPAWWQLWKGLYEAGAELIVTPYRGRALEAPWWRTYENPCYREGEAYALARQAAARLRGEAHLRRAEDAPPDTAS